MRIPILAALVLLTRALVPANGTVRVEVRERKTGHPIPARLYLTDQNGNFHAPPGAIVYDKRGERHFIAPRPFAIELPPGKYTLAAERGPEYLRDSATFTVEAGKERTVALGLPQLIDMNARGWYSGDLHNHRAVAEMPDLLLAENLNLAPGLIDWVWADEQRGRPPNTGEAIRAVDATHVYSVLDKEVERLESGPGAVDLLGLRRAIPFEGYRLYPPNSVFCDAAHEQGGYVDAEKIVWRDVVALVARGRIDFAGIVHNHFNRQDVELETDRWGMIPKWKAEFSTVAGMPLWSMEVYYHFLNCGFRLPVSAGSASGVKAAPLGYARVYVKTGGPFSYAAWFRALKEGHSFATNGPMLFLTVEGQEPGGVIRHAGRVKVHADAFTGAGALDRLEIVADGRVIQTSTGMPDILSADAEVTFDRSGWVAARCFEPAGKTIRFAHTSPVYIEIEGRPARAAQDARFFLEWIDRAIAFYIGEQGFREPRHRDEMLAFFRDARAVYEKIFAR
jgi:TolB protein